jgi:dUTPase
MEGEMFTFVLSLICNSIIVIFCIYQLYKAIKEKPITIKYVTQFEEPLLEDNTLLLRIDISNSHKHFNLKPGATESFNTGTKFLIPEGYECDVVMLPSFASRGIVINFNAIDSNYRGSIHVLVTNNSKQNFQLHHGMKIARIFFRKSIACKYERVSGVDFNRLTDKNGGR